MSVKKKMSETEREMEETCTWFGSFIETRYDPEHIPAGDERLLYQVHSLRTQLSTDGDGGRESIRSQGVDGTKDERSSPGFGSLGR